MSKGFIVGMGGGAPLNFKVVGGTEAPTNPNENTIWVNTANEITSWVFSASQPGAPAEGMVWFKTTTAAKTAFNVLKKNKIEVYPIECRQYIGGAWVSKTPKTYQSGAWQNWTYYIFNVTDPCTDITGGWKAYGANAYFVSGYGYLGVKAQSSNKDYPGIGGTVDPIDLTNFKTLKGMACRRVDAADVALIGVAKTQTNATSGFVASAKPAYSSSGAFLDFTLDISGLSGPHYIALASAASGGSYYWVQAQQLWLE